MLGATSGDTGGAAIYGMRGKAGAQNPGTEGLGFIRLRM